MRLLAQGDALQERCSSAGAPSRGQQTLVPKDTQGKLVTDSWHQCQSALLRLDKRRKSSKHFHTRWRAPST
jgi:hypothetical protein